MKTPNVCLSASFALATLIVGSLSCLGADAPPPPGAPAPPASPVVNPVNYVLRVDWKSSKGGTNSLQFLTTEGNFRLDGSQPNVVKLGDSELPIFINVSGDLKALNPQQGRLQFFLGRSVPYVTRAGGPSGNSNIQQRQEGLTLNFVVTFGQPVVIQKDANGEISVLVERESL